MQTEKESVSNKQCPNCGSYKTRGNSPREKLKYGSFAFMIIGALLTLFIITAIIGIPMFLTGVCMYVASRLLPETGGWMCTDCHKTWR